MFIYVISLASNEIFNFSLKINSIIIILLILIFITTIFLDKYIIIWNFKNNELNNILNQFSFILENSLLLNKLYNFPINLITIILIIYLFLTLIAIVKISQIFEGPLRPKK